MRHALRVRTLTPTPLPQGEGLLPASPTGRRCPAGADEGTGRSLVQSKHRMRFALRPSPQPLSRRERGLYVPSPLGRRCPEGADEGTGAASCSRNTARASRPTLTPTPLPEGEGLLPSSPSGRRCPEGADEGKGAASCSRNTACASRPYPHPNPSPGGRGAKPFTAGVFCASRHEPRTSGAPRYRGPHTSASRSRAGAGACFTRPPCTATPSARRR